MIPVDAEPTPPELAGLHEAQARALGPLWRTLWRERGLLLAWPLGAGKTWIACALARLAARRAGLRTIIVAPARLLPMWRQVAARLELTPLAVVSHRRASLDALPAPTHAADAHTRLWLVDEAHAFRNLATAGHRALARAVAAGRVVLLTATPLNTALTDVAALLALFGAVPSPAADADRVARALERVASFGPEQPPLPLEQRRTALRVAPCHPGRLDAWRAAIDALAQAPWPVFGSATHDTARRLILEVLASRLLAHPVALLASLRRLRRYYTRCVDPRGGLLDRATFTRLFGDDGPTQGLLPFAWPVEATRTAAEDDETLRVAVLEAISRSERALRRAVLPWASEPRITALAAWCEARVGVPRRSFALPQESAPVVCFTGSAEVARHVAGELAARGFAVGLVTGGTARLSDKSVAAEVVLAGLDPFAGAPVRCQVLVCTDVLGQGHNLQRAQALVHLDRPWNPVRLAQREGRLLRPGQQARTVELATLVADPEHPLLVELESRLARALGERTAQAQALYAEARRGSRSSEGGFELAGGGWPAQREAEVLIGALLERVRPLRRHPQARDWLARIARVRQALGGGRLPTGARLAVAGLIEEGLAPAPDAALRQVEGALQGVLPGAGAGAWEAARDDR